MAKRKVVGDLIQLLLTSPNGVSLWNTIRYGCTTFSCYIQFEVGDGHRVKFWHDIWCGESPLKMSFLELFRIIWDKDVNVAAVMKFSKGILYWDLNFMRAVLEVFVQFYGYYSWHFFE